jgi:hypothetical protein
MPRAVATFHNDTYDEETYDNREGSVLGRLHITRTFEGDITGHSSAELLTARSPDGSAAYVAIDRINGSVNGREGSFVLASSAGAVVPGSGTGELRGLAGEAEITVDEDGVHRLALEFTLGS